MKVAVTADIHYEGGKMSYSFISGVFEANSGCNNHTKSGKIFIDKNVSENSLSLFKVLSGSQIFCEVK